jgi:hypothetical protein
MRKICLPVVIFVYLHIGAMGGVYDVLEEATPTVSALTEWMFLCVE